MVCYDALRAIAYTKHVYLGRYLGTKTRTLMHHASILIAT